jgi:hypothetical protein
MILCSVDWGVAVVRDELLDMEQTYCILYRGYKDTFLVGLSSGVPRNFFRGGSINSV